MVKVEVCTENLASALTAQQCGAYRVELCDNLSDGGTTPSYGTIAEARKWLTIKLYPIIRPRGGDFFYDDRDFAVMQRDVAVCGEAGCDGVVFGILRGDGTIDRERCRQLVDIARSYGIGAAFHRAFDTSADRACALEEIIELGFERVLTSGGEATVQRGTAELKRLVEQAADRITVMAGAGITPENAGPIITATGCREIHGTFRSRYASAMTFPAPGWADASVWQADPDKVRSVVETAAKL